MYFTTKSFLEVISSKETVFHRTCFGNYSSKVNTAFSIFACTAVKPNELVSLKCFLLIYYNAEENKYFQNNYTTIINYFIPITLHCIFSSNIINHLLNLYLLLGSLASHYNMESFLLKPYF